MSDSPPCPAWRPSPPNQLALPGSPMPPTPEALAVTFRPPRPAVSTGPGVAHQRLVLGNSAWLSGRSGRDPSMKRLPPRARAGQGFGAGGGSRCSALQPWMARRVGGQVGRLVEDTALPDDGIDQVGVPVGGWGCLQAGGPHAIPPPERLPGLQRAWRDERVSTPGRKRRPRHRRQGVGRVGAGAGWGAAPGCHLSAKELLEADSPCPSLVSGDPLTTSTKGNTWQSQVELTYQGLAQLFNIFDSPPEMVTEEEGPSACAHAATPLETLGDRSVLGLRTLPSRPRALPSPHPPRRPPHFPIPLLPRFHVLPSVTMCGLCPSVFFCCFHPIHP